MEKKCNICGELIKPTKYNAVYCSPACRIEASVVKRKERNLKAREKVCKVCRVPFKTNRKDTLFCCKACKQVEYRQRKKATKQQSQQIKVTYKPEVQQREVTPILVFHSRRGLYSGKKQ